MLNIYFSGPDGVGKSTLAMRLRHYLVVEKDLHAEVVPLPSLAGPASCLIKLHLRDRITFDNNTLDGLFVADRLDTAAQLQKIREREPGTIFIFDRGPVDGACYGAARLDDVEERDDYVKWVRACDSKFLEMFPADLGLLILGTPEVMFEKMLQRRQSFKESDRFDRDKRLQQELPSIFQQVVGSDLVKWRTIVVEDINLGKEFAAVKLYVEELLKNRGIETRFATKRKEAE